VSSTKRKIEIQGISPFKQASGVFEVQISISKEKPSEQSINAKNFETVWKDTVHLRVTGGKFSTVLGSGAKTLPDEVFKLDSIWIVVSDQFSNIHTVFDVKISEITSGEKKETSKTLSEKTKRSLSEYDDY